MVQLRIVGLFSCYFDSVYFVAGVWVLFLGLINSTTKLSKANNNAPINAGINPLILNPGTKNAVNPNIRALMTNENKPRESTVMGKDIKPSIGRMSVLTKPNTAAAIKATKKLSIWMAGIK